MSCQLWSDLTRHKLNRVFSDVFVGFSGFRASQAEQLETFVFNVSGRVHESNWFLYLSAACFVI